MPRYLAVVIASVVCLVCLLFILLPAFARNDGRYDDNPLRKWFDGLRNQKNFPCCEQSDGLRLEDPDWRTEQDGSYSVRLEGQWVPVPPEAVLTEPNKVTYSVVWRFQGRITCFLVGPLY